MLTISYSNGRTATADTLGAALIAIRATYPEAVAYHEDGGEAYLEDAIVTGQRVLVWETEEDSHDDDGARALASIHVRSGA